MSRKDIYKDNKGGFQTNPQNINRTGANRKTVSTVIIELQKDGVEQVKPKQVIELFESLLNCKEAELNEIISDKEQPMINRIVAKEMLNKRGFEIIERMLNRIHGTPKQSVEVEQKENNLNIIVQNENTKKLLQKINETE